MIITKTLTFDSAHMLSNYEGKCANLHGHTYKVTVSIDAEPEAQAHMVMDYNEIKKVFEAVDHAIIFSGAGIRDTAEEDLLKWAVLHDMRRYILPDNCKCTAEDMAQHFAEVIRHLFITDYCIVYVDLSETISANARGVAK
jgi:6-pyruvoyltetrahydropterin/6-carboxytetrahydropterin synthase